MFEDPRRVIRSAVVGEWMTDDTMAKRYRTKTETMINTTQ